MIEIESNPEFSEKRPVKVARRGSTAELDNSQHPAALDKKYGRTFRAAPACFECRLYAIPAWRHRGDCPTYQSLAAT
jgi:hypothetical protein